MTEQQAKRTRRKIGYQVQVQTIDGDWSDENLPHDTMALALKTIKDSGSTSQTYAIVRRVWGPHMVKTETITKRIVE